MIYGCAVTRLGTFGKDRVSIVVDEFRNRELDDQTLAAKLLEMGFSATEARCHVALVVSTTD